MWGGIKKKKPRDDQIKSQKNFAASANILIPIKKHTDLTTKPWGDYEQPMHALKINK